MDPASKYERLINPATDPKEHEAAPTMADDMLREWRTANPPPSRVPFSKLVDVARQKKKIAVVVKSSEYINEARSLGFEVYWREGLYLVPHRLIEPNPCNQNAERTEWVYIPHGANIWEVYRDTTCIVVEEDRKMCVACMRFRVCLCGWCS